jgi:hypothetical protein
MHQLRKTFIHFGYLLKKRRNNAVSAAGQAPNPFGDEPRFGIPPPTALCPRQGPGMDAGRRDSLNARRDIGAAHRSAT